MNTEVERKIQEIIRNEYAFGYQNIEREEIYKKLIEQAREPLSLLCTRLQEGKS